MEKSQINAEALVKMMVGRDLSTFYQKQHDPAAVHGDIALQVQTLPTVAGA